MTIEALFNKHSLVSTIRLHTRTAINPTGMALGNMALLAEIWLTGNQQVLVIRPMWGMAVAAVFLHGGMFPQEWATFLGVTAVTGIVDIIFGEQEVVIAVVHIVAIAAAHVAKTQRVPRRLEGVGTCALVAIEADFLLPE